MNAVGFPSVWIPMHSFDEVALRNAIHMIPDDKEEAGNLIEYIQEHNSNVDKSIFIFD